MLEDVEFSERDGKEHAIVCTAGSECDELADVVLGGLAEETNLVCCRETGGEEKTKRAGCSGRRLAADILLRPKVASTEILG